MTQLPVECVWEKFADGVRCAVCGTIRPYARRRLCSISPPTAPTYLGDHIERALTSIGVTKEWYAEKKDELGLPPGCDCDERQHWLNKTDRRFRAWLKEKASGVTWACAVTTVPQRAALLAQTLDSLRAAGFDDLAVFEDTPKLGHIERWKQTLKTLCETDPYATYYAVFQDDVIACRNLREYLEQGRYKTKTFLNLITFDENLRFTKQQRGWHESNQCGKGAQGLVLTNLATQELIHSKPFVESHLLTGTKRSIDGMVTMGLKAARYKELVHYPSLLQHVGKPSVIGPKHNRFGPVKAWQPEFDPLA